MGSRDVVDERDTVLVRCFYRAGTKMSPRFMDGIGVSGLRNATLDPNFCDYVHDRERLGSQVNSPDEDLGEPHRITQIGTRA